MHQPAELSFENFRTPIDVRPLDNIDPGLSGITGRTSEKINSPTLGE